MLGLVGFDVCYDVRDVGEILPLYFRVPMSSRLVAKANRTVARTAFKFGLYFSPSDNAFPPK